jgi:hypothetical protein
MKIAMTVDAARAEKSKRFANCASPCAMKMLSVVEFNLRLCIVFRGILQFRPRRFLDCVAGGDVIIRFLNFVGSLDCISANLQVGWIDS